MSCSTWSSATNSCGGWRPLRAWVRRLYAHRVVDGGAVLEETGQDLVDVADRERIVRTEIAHRPLRARAAAVPRLACGVALADEEHVLGLLAPRDEHGDGLGLAEAGEIVEVAVLAVGVFDVVIAVPDGRRRHDHDRGATDDPHELAPAPGEFVARDARGGGLQCSGSP